MTLVYKKYKYLFYPIKENLMFNIWQECHPRQNDYKNTHSSYFFYGCDANRKLLIRSRKNFVRYSFDEYCETNLRYSTIDFDG